MPKQITDQDIELLDSLGVDTSPEKKQTVSPREQRIIAGFEEIERFVEENGRLPQHGEDRDIFERLYAVRLDRMRQSQECREALEGIDKNGLLGDDFSPNDPSEGASDEELLAALGVEKEPSSELQQLKHVRSSEEKQAAEEIAQRTPCPDFKVFKPLFEKVQADLDSGFRKTIKFQDNAEVKQGDFFILDGLKVYVAEMGEPFINDYSRQDRRLRVVFGNAMESDLLLRSLQRALNKDKASRRITDPSLGPLFSDEESEDDLQTGYIYILRSKSDHPFITENRNVIHKIGVTSGSVQRRIANAKKDPTYLFADVEIVQTYKLANIKPNHLEKLLHKFFSAARLELEMKDRFGHPVEPREWFLVPLDAIEATIERLKDGSISEVEYNAKAAEIQPSKAV
jgi:hypothetical protein